jgi:hypothetical protein
MVADLRELPTLEDLLGWPSGRSFVASGLCDDVQPGRNGPAPWTRHDAFYITSFGCGRSERGNLTVGRDANEGLSRNGRASALSFRVRPDRLRPDAIGQWGDLLGIPRTQRGR